jgi:hypothetical protein
LTVTNKVTYRNIAKMLASALPVEGEDFGKKIEANLEVIKALPTYQKNALKMAYIFSRKVPRQEREDLFQELALGGFKAKTRDEKLAYAVARCDWINWWKKFKVRQHYSLDTVIEDEDGNLQRVGELIVGEVDFEYRLDGKVDAERIWHKLPDNVKPIVRDRLLGKALTSTERSTLNRWIKSTGYQLLLN